MTISCVFSPILWLSQSVGGETQISQRLESIKILAENPSIVNQIVNRLFYSFLKGTPRSSKKARPSF